MRVLLYTLPMLSDIWRDGTFLMAFDLAEALVEQGSHVYLSLPERYQKAWEKEFPAEGVQNGITPVWEDRIGRYRFRDRFRMVTNHHVIENFSRRYGKFQVDWVWCFEPEPAPYLRSLISDETIESLLPVPVLIREIGALESADYYFGMLPLADRAVNMSRAVSFLSGYPVFFTQREAKRAGEEYRRWLSPYGLKEMNARTLVLPPHIAETRIQKMLGVPRRERFTAFYGGRISAGKRPDRIGRILQVAQAKGGEDFDVVVSASNSSLTQAESRKLAALFHSTVHFQVVREEYWKLAASCHVGLCGSESENFGMGFLEQLFLGLPVLVYKSPTGWTNSVYPSWYPWFYESEEQAIQMLLALRDEIRSDRLVGEMARVQEWLQGFVGKTTVLSRIHDFVKPLVYPAPTKDGVTPYRKVPMPQRQLLAKAIHALRGKTVTFGIILRIMSQLARSFSSNRVVRARRPMIAADYDFYRTLRDEWLIPDDFKKRFSTFSIPEDFIPPVDFQRKKGF